MYLYRYLPTFNFRSSFQLVDTSVEGCEGRGEEIFRAYMNKVTSELTSVLVAGTPAMDMRSSSGNTLAVFGHAVFLNALAVAVGEAMGIRKAKELVGGMDLGETQVGMHMYPCV